MPLFLGVNLSFKTLLKYLCFPFNDVSKDTSDIIGVVLNSYHWTTKNLAE